MGHKRRTHSEVATLAAAQHGVVSAEQLSQRGFSRKVIATEVTGGRLHRIHRGVYAVGHVDLAWHGRVMAAVLACSPAVASHWTAGRLWGLGHGGETIHLTAPTRRHRRKDPIVHFAALDAADIGSEAGIPVTSLARTVLDLAPLVDAKRLAKLLERAEELKDDDGRHIFDLREFESLLRRTRGHPGHRRLARALDLYKPDPTVTRSGLERTFRTLVRRAGLPVPAMNFVVGAYEIDAYWEAERFGVELDVFATHGSRRSFEEDRERQDDLLAIGVEITRVTDKRLGREPAAVMRRLGEHLARRAPSPPPSPRAGAPARGRR